MKESPVSLFDPGDKSYNTIALDGVEVIIPLEEDLDCDPLQDDEIRLLSLDGSFEEIIKASDPDAKPDHEKALIYYHFKQVPPGYYRISVRIAAIWVDISTDLLVSPRGVHFAGSRLGREAPPVSFQVRRQERETGDSLVEPRQARPPRYIDLNQSFRDREE